MLRLKSLNFGSSFLLNAIGFYSTGQGEGNKIWGSFPAIWLPYP
jgi:hypothetical protein